MDSKLERAQTEALFRDVNERIAESARRFGSDRAEFVCECADPGCTSRIELSLEQYERIRADGTHFVLVPGHEDRSIERVIECRETRATVEKMEGIPATTVRRLDPRSGPA